MNKGEKILLDRSLKLLKKLIENGSFFISAIELDPHDCRIDGEEFKEKIEKLLKDANIEFKENK